MAANDKRGPEQTGPYPATGPEFVYHITGYDAEQMLKWTASMTGQLIEFQ